MTAVGGDQASLTSALTRVKSAVDLGALNIDTDIRYSIGGGLLIEVLNKEGGSEKADLLLGRMLAVLGEGSGVRVPRPVKLAEMRVSELEGSVTPAAVAKAVAEVGGCSVGEIRTGSFRRAPSGFGSIWVRLPMSAALKVADVRKIKVGWAWATSELLRARP